MTPFKAGRQHESLFRLVLILLLGSACTTDLYAPIPRIDSRRSAIVLVDDEDGVRAFAFDAVEPAMAPSIELREEARLVLLLFDAPLDGLNLSPGRIPPPTGFERPLPPAAAYFEAIAEGDIEWSELLGLPEQYASFRIPASTAEECADAGGCYADSRAVEARICAIPCSVSSVDVGEIGAPAPPEAPIMFPCPSGWLEDDGACSPPLRLTCPPGQVQWIDEEACSPIDACPVGRFLDNPPAGALFVDSSASPGGDGSETNPYRAIAEAVAAVPPGGTIAVSRGTHTGSVAVFGVSIVGACAAETEIVGVGSSPALMVGSIDVRGVTLRADAGSAVISTGVFTFHSVRVVGSATAFAPALSVRGGAFTGTSLVIDAPLSAGVDITAGSADVERAVIGASQGVSSFGGGRIRLVDAVVHGSRGSGLQTAGALVLARTLFEGHEQYGIQKYSSGDVRIEDTVVRDCGSPSFQFGGGLQITSATSTIVRVLVEDVRNQGIGLGGRARIRDTIVRRVIPFEEHVSEAAGITGFGGAPSLLRVRVESTHGRGIGWSGSGDDLISLEDVEISSVGDADLANIATQGFGFTSFNGRVAASRIRVTGAHTTGVFAGEGARVDILDAIVAGSTNGNGIGLRSIAGFSLERAILEDNEVTGFETDGATGTVNDVSVVGGRIGLTFGGGGEIEGARVSVKDAIGLGLCVHDQIVVTLEHLSVERTARIASAPCTVTMPPPGTGVFLNGQPNITLQHFRIAQSEGIGIVVNRDSTTSLLDGEISGSFTGAQVDPSIDPASLMVRVRFRDNETNFEQ